jgi:hypothetical protein
MLTSRADNIAIGTSGYAGLPAASGWPPAEHQDHFWSPSAVTASINLVRASSGELDGSPQVSRPLKARWGFT